MMDFGDDGMGVHNLVTNVGNDYVRVYYELCLEVDSW